MAESRRRVAVADALASHSVSYVEMVFYNEKLQKPITSSQVRLLGVY